VTNSKVSGSSLVERAEKTRRNGFLEFSSSVPNFSILETAKNEPHRSMAQKTGLKIENGWIELPTTPGLGIELDEEVIKAHPYSPRDYASAYYPDGSVADI